jgi:hypothetical protein
MSLTDRFRRVPNVLWAALFAIVLILPGLGNFGFWDPWELSLAERAREISESGAITDVTLAGRYAARPPFDLAINALGMKLLGPSEWGGRLLQGLVAIGALLAVYWAGVGLLRQRAALLAVLVLGTMPLFFLQARQLTSDMGLTAALALSFGGLGRFTWPASGRRRWMDLGLACVGLVVGYWAGGGLLGVALPCLSIVGTVLATWSLIPANVSVGSEQQSTLTAPGVGSDVPAEVSFGRGLFFQNPRGSVPLVLLAVLGAAVLFLAVAAGNVVGQYNPWLGGAARGGTPTQLFDYFVKQIGFGTFPWSALLVFALGRALVRGMDGNGSDPDPRARLAFVDAFCLVSAGFGFALSTVYVLLVGDARFAVLAPIALAIGAFLDEAIEAERPQPVLGLLAATGTMILARDFNLVPEDLFSVHLLETLKWPPTLKVGAVPLIVGFVVASGVYLGLALRPRALVGWKPTDPSDLTPPLTGNSLRWAKLYAFATSTLVKFGRFGIHAAVAGAILFSLGVSHVLVPYLSKHYSFKPVFQSLLRFSKPGDPFGRYRVQGHGIQFYTARQMEDIPSQDKLLDFFRKNPRAFCLVATEDLAALDAAFKTGNVSYYVLDASSNRFLLMSNVLDGHPDENPLKRNVWMAPSPPILTSEPGAVPVTYKWPDERPPWTWPVKLNTIFQDSVELVGADFPSSLRRPGKIGLTMYFRVLKRPAPGFKMFVHIDTPGHPRLIGDHEPLAGAFPTSYWLPGEYIRDFTEIEVPRMTTMSGTYTAYVGFWPGGESARWKITSGLNDGGDRAQLGTIEIR